MERKRFRANHPHGFVARPVVVQDACGSGGGGEVDLRTWECGIPGKLGTPWEGATYNLRMEFPVDYPLSPPRCKFTPPVFHPNVYPDGVVCSSLLVAEGGHWHPGISVVELLVALQAFLQDVNPSSPAQSDALVLYVHDRDAYDRRVREGAAQRRLESASERGGDAHDDEQNLV